MAKICNNCGTKVKDDVYVCPKCGMSENGILAPNSEQPQQPSNQPTNQDFYANLNNVNEAYQTNVFLAELIKIEKENAKRLKSITTNTSFTALIALIQLLLILSFWAF